MTQSLVVSWPGAAEPGPNFFAVPPAAIADLPSFLAWCAVKADADPEITVVVTDDAHRALHLPETPDMAATTLDVEGRALLDVEGWEHGPAGPWITYRRGNHTRVHLGVWSWMARRPRDHSLFLPVLAGPRPIHQPCGPILVQLEAWRTLTELPYRGIPGIAGTSLLRALTARRGGRGPLWHHGTPINAHEPEIGSWRSPAAEEAPEFRQSWDTNRAYLAAAGCAEVCIDRLVNTGPIEFDPRRAGWWLIDADPWMLPSLLPDPVYQRTRGNGSGVAWATTPTVKLLHDLYPQGRGVPGFTVLDSWTGRGTRAFRGWAGCLNNACLTTMQAQYPTELTTAQLAAFKDAYRQAIGLMNHEGGAIYRPDWHYTILAQARATLWRKLWNVGHTTGRWPIAISTDAVTYASPYRDCEEHENPGFPIGDALGQWKVKKNVRIR